MILASIKKYQRNEKWKFLEELYKYAKDEKHWVTKTVKQKKGMKKVKYLNCPVSFDTETTSMQEYKAAHVYAWMFGFNEHVYIARNIEEFRDMLVEISKTLKLSDDKRIRTYVHNYGFDFEFIKDFFIWTKTFATDKHKPLETVSVGGFEFRDSYVLLGMSLEKVTENLVHHDCRKLVGNLDYNKIRNTKTELTEKEIDYCMYDVYCLNCAIAEEMEQNNDRICDIVMTKTGYVRRYLRGTCNSKENYAEYRKLMSTCILTSDMYKMWKKAYTGGFTHANRNKVGLSDAWDGSFSDVVSYDFTSSYPAVMLSERYPMGKPKKIVINDFYEYMYHVKEKKRILIMNIRFSNYKIKAGIPDVPISASKCTALSKNKVVDNGRLISADELAITLTNIDLEYIFRCIDLSETKIYFDECFYYETDYLPKSVVEAILHFYEGKTTLKGISGKEQEYQLLKGMLNAIYGCCVEDVIKDLVEYKNGSWHVRCADLEKELDKYNKSENRVIYYPWGCCVSAYARRNLWTGILECGDDYIYSDTDSLKIENFTRHKDYFEKYNERITQKIDDCLKHYNIDVERSRPRTKKGVAKPLGIWDFDGFYRKFKTLGAKRYICLDEKRELHVTVAGCPKKSMRKFLLKESKRQNKSVFDIFTNELSIDTEESGKNTSYYMKETMEYECTDFQGNTEHIVTHGGVCIAPATFGITLSPEYISLILEIMQNSQKCA